MVIQWALCGAISEPKEMPEFPDLTVYVESLEKRVVVQAVANRHPY